MNINLIGKVAVVSGGATLIGKAVVQALVSAGAHVAILDIDAKGKAIAESFNHDGACKLFCVSSIFYK